MNRNVEIKAKVVDLEAIRQRVQELADEGPTVSEQEDTFFSCPKGRLKLRRSIGHPTRTVCATSCRWRLASEA